MEKQYQRRIRNFFIKRNFQGKIILSLFLSVTFGCLLFIVIFGFISADTMTISYKNNELQMGQTPVMLLRNALAANWIFLVTCGTLLVIAAIVGTHRIAGPIYRFEKTLDNMIDKDLSDIIRLREKDEGKDLAHKINHFNKTLSADLKQLNRRSRAIGDLLNQYGSYNNSSLSAEEIECICKAIQNNNDKIKDILAPYQLADDR